MRKFFEAALDWAREDLPSWLLDLIALLAIAAVLHGVALIYVPAAWILGGLVIFALVQFAEQLKHLRKG